MRYDLCVRGVANADLECLFRFGQLETTVGKTETGAETHAPLYMSSNYVSLLAGPGHHS